MKKQISFVLMCALLFAALLVSAAAAGGDMGASPDCRALLRSLVAEQRTLPARLPPGRYRTITHGTVLRRLQAMETAGEITAIPIYTATLGSIRKQMTGGHCKRCRAVCPLRTGAEKPRMFYYVRFRIV